jgi:hypothetical protein
MQEGGPRTSVQTLKTGRIYRWCRRHPTTIAQEFQGNNDTVFINLEPGYITTRIIGWDGDTGMETSVEGMVNVIEKVGREDSCLLISYPSKKIPF